MTHNKGDDGNPIWNEGMQGGMHDVGMSDDDLDRIARNTITSYVKALEATNADLLEACDYAYWELQRRYPDIAEDVRNTLANAIEKARGQ